MANFVYFISYFYNDFLYRMMTNGLTDIKTTLFVKHRNCQAALEKLLEEQSDIRQHLRATNRYDYSSTSLNLVEDVSKQEQVLVIPKAHLHLRFSMRFFFSFR